MARDLSLNIKDLAERRLPFVLLVGGEYVRRKRALEFYIESLRGVVESFSIKKTSVVEISSNQGFSKLADDLNVLGLFSKFQLTIISSNENISADFQKKLIPLLERANPLGSVILVCEKLQAQSAILKFAQKSGCLIELKTLQGAEIFQWTMRELKRHHRTAKRGVVEFLIEQCEGNVDYLTTRIEQLALYTSEDEVTEQDVRALLLSGRSEDEFSFLQSIVDGASPALLRRKLARCPLNPFGFVTLLQKNLLGAAALKEQSSARNDLGLSPWMMQRLKKRIASTNQMKAIKELNAALRLESRLKHKSLEQIDIISLYLDESGAL